ncbi:hypothetical protein FNF29_01517 [Cafeteria roenbergensis]|uniref:RING-type E3 ubiquitin transferase n=1 Tax=Cafeteria roenbergensis TaxID=33653 RepID=A0A5A8CTU1_CAFRO|nr:hypothetical protein FNF29_01517 [Cafeteria roenbergensis]|eukprot:KAA0155600.1 hypothetical protein FNF29_01517 [Cafeteria roenbergensis]
MLVLLLASVALAQTPYPKSLPLYFLFNLDASVRNLGSSIAMHDGDLAIGQWNQAYVTEMGYDLTSSQVLQDATLASSDVDGSAPPGPVGVDTFGGLSVAWSDRRAVLLASKAGDGQWVRAAELGSNVGRPTSFQATASSDIPEPCRLAALGSASSEQFSARIVKAAVGPGTLAVTVHLSRQDGAFCRSVAVFEEACLPGRGLESPAERLALDLLVNGTVPMRGNASVANGTAGRPWLVQAGPGDPRPDAGYSALLNATSAIAVGEPGSCRRGAAGPTAAWGSHPLKAAAAAAARPLWLRTGLVLSDDASFGNALTISADALVVGVPDAPGGGAAAMLRRGAPFPQRPQAGPGWETASLGSLSDALAVPSAGAAAWQAAMAGATACLAADVNATSALACFEAAHEATMRAAGDAAGGWLRLGWGSSPLAATSDAAAGRLWASRWHNAGTLSPGLVLQAAFPEQATSVSTAGWRFGAAVSLRDPLLVVGSPGADTHMLPARATPDAPGVAGEVGAAGSGAVWAFEAPARIGGVVPDSLVAVGALSDGWNWERAAETSQAFRTLDAGATVDAASHAAAVEAATQARLLSGAVARARAEAAEQAAASATASDPSTPQVERRAADPLKWPRPRHDAGARAGDPAAGAWFRVDGETAAAQRRLGGAAVSVWLSAGAHATPGGIGLGCLASQGSAGGGMGASLASLTKGDTSFIFAGAPGVNTVFVTQLRRPVNASLVGVAPAGTRLAQGSIPRCQALEGVVGFDVTSESNAGATLAVSHGTLYIGAPDASNAGRGATAQPGRVYVKQFCFETGVVTPSRFPFSRESPGFCSPCSGQHIAPSFSSTAAECTTCLRDLPDLAMAQPPDNFPCAFQCDPGSFGTECRTCSQFQFRQGASLPPGAIWADAKDVCGWTCPAGFRLLPNATGCEPPPPPAPPLLAAVLPAVEPSSAAGPNASAALSAVAVGSVFEAAFAVPANYDEPAPLLSAKALLFPAAAMPAVASPTSAAMAIDVAWTPVASLSAWSLATGDELPTTIAHVSGVQAANEATRAAMATLAAAGGGNATLAQMIQEGSASVFTARFSYMPRGFEGAIGLAVGNGGGWGNATLALSLINASVVAADAALSGPWQLDVSASPKAPELARSGEIAWPREMLAIPASGAAAVAWAPPLGQAVFPSLGLGDFPVPHDPTLQTQLCIMAPPSVLDAVCSTGVLLTLGKPASSQWLPPALQPAQGGWPLKRVVAIVDDQTWSGLDFALGVQAPASGAAPRARSLVVTGLRAGMLLSLAVRERVPNVGWTPFSEPASLRVPPVAAPTGPAAGSSTSLTCSFNGTTESAAAHLEFVLPPGAFAGARPTLLWLLRPLRRCETNATRLQCWTAPPSPPALAPPVLATLGDFERATSGLHPSPTSERAQLNASLGLLGIQVAGNGTAPVASLLGAGGFGRAVGFQELLPGGSMDTPLLLAEPDGAVRVSLHADAIPGGFDVAVALVLQNEAGPSRAGAVAVCSAPAPVAPAAPPAVAWDSSTSPGASSPGPDGVILLGRAPSFLGRSPLAGMRFEAAAVRGPGMGHSFTGTADSRSDLLVPGSGLDAALELSAPPLWALTHYCGRSSATNAAALDGPWSSPEAATLVPEQHGTACVQTSAAVAPSAPGVPSIVQQQVAPSVLALMWDAPAQVGGDRVEEYLLQMADSATGVVAWEQVLTTPLQRNASAGPADHTRAVALVGGVVPSAAARTFRVAARTAAGGESQFGPALSVVFDRAVHPPGTPGRLATSPVTHLSGPALQLKWRPPLDTGSASAPLSFEVQVVSTNASHGVLANRSSPSSSSSSSSSSPVQQHQQQATSVLFNSSAVQCQRVAVAWHSPATALAALAASQAAPLECTAELVGLQAHAAFELRIRASNGAGPGPWSASSELVVTGPPAPPTPPRVWATQRSGQSWIEACWLPGSSDGGSPVTSFALSATVARHSPALAAFANETLFGGIQARIAWKGVAPQSLSSADAWLEPVQVGAVSVAQGMAAGVLQSGGSASQAGAMSAGAGAGSDSLGAQQCAHVRGLPGASVVHIAVAATTAAGTSAVSAAAHEDAVAMAAESDADHRRFGLALTALAAPPGSVSELTVLPANNSSGSSLGLAELVFRCPVDWGGGAWLDAPGLRLWLHPASQAARNASCAGARAEGHSELPSEVHVVDVPPWAIELVNGSTSSQLVAGDEAVPAWQLTLERAEEAPSSVALSGMSPFTLAPQGRAEAARFVVALPAKFELTPGLIGPACPAGPSGTEPSLFESAWAPANPPARAAAVHAGVSALGSSESLFAIRLSSPTAASGVGARARLVAASEDASLDVALHPSTEASLVVSWHGVSERAAAGHDIVAYRVRAATLRAGPGSGNSTSSSALVSLEDLQLAARAVPLSDWLPVDTVSAPSGADAWRTSATVRLAPLSYPESSSHPVAAASSAALPWAKLLHDGQALGGPSVPTSTVLGVTVTVVTANGVELASIPSADEALRSGDAAALGLAFARCSPSAAVLASAPGHAYTAATGARQAALAEAGEAAPVLAGAPPPAQPVPWLRSAGGASADTASGAGFGILARVPQSLWAMAERSPTAACLAAAVRSGALPEDVDLPDAGLQNATMCELQAGVWLHGASGQQLAPARGPDLLLALPLAAGSDAWAPSSSPSRSALSLGAAGMPAAVLSLDPADLNASAAGRSAALAVTGTAHASSATLLWRLAMTTAASSMPPAELPWVLAVTSSGNPGSLNLTANASDPSAHAAAPPLRNMSAAAVADSALGVAVSWSLPAFAPASLASSAVAVCAVDLGDAAASLPRGGALDDAAASVAAALYRNATSQSGEAADVPAGARAFCPANGQAILVAPDAGAPAVLWGLRPGRAYAIVASALHHGTQHTTARVSVPAAVAWKSPVLQSQPWPPARPLLVAVQGVGATSAALRVLPHPDTGSAPALSSVSCRVQVVGDGGEWVAAAEARTRELPFPAPVLVVSGLRAGTTYRGMCRVLSSAGASPERPSASFRTALPDPASEPQNVVVLPETLELPEAVHACAAGAALSSSAGNSSTAGLQARARGPTWMSLRWDPPATDGGSDVLSYVVVVSCEESRTLGSDAAAGAWGSATSAGVPSSLSSGFASGTATRGVRVGNVTRAVLRGLPAGCSATVTVAAVTAAGRGSAAVAASGLRLPLPPAEALALPGVDAASVRLEAPSAGPGPLLVAKWAPGPHALRLGVASQAFVLLLNRTLQPGLPPAGNPGGDAVWAKDPPSLFALVNAAPAARAAAWAAEAVTRASGSECGVSEVGCLGQVPAQLPSGAAAAAALQPAAWLGEYGESIAGALATAAQANGVCGAARDSDGVGWAVQGLDASASLEWSHTVPSATARARYALSVAHARSAASVAAFSAEAAAIQASLVRGVRPAFPPAVELGLAAALAAGGLERGEAAGNATAVTRDAVPPGPVGRPALAASAGPDCLDLAWAVPETHGRPVIGYAVRIEDAEAAATEAAVRRAPFPWNSSVTPDGVVWGPHARLAPPPLSILTVLPADRNLSDAVRAAAAALGEASPLAALPAPRTLEQGDTGVPLSAGFQQSPSPEGAHSVRICGLRQFRSYEVSVVAISVAGVGTFHEAPASLPLSTEASVPPGPVRSLRVADLRVVADAVGVATKAEGGHFLRETRSVWTENSPEDRARAWDTWQNALPLSALAAAPPAWGKNALGPLREAAPVALVSWLPPVSLGGSPLLCYEVSVRAVGVVADPCGSGPGRKACAPGEDGRPSSGVASMWSAGDRSWDSLVQQALGPGAGPAANAIVSPRDSDGKAPETISDAMSLLFKAGLSGSALWPDDAHEGESAQAPQIWPQSAVPVTGTPESGLQISSNTTMGPGDAWAAEWGTGSPTSRAPLPPGVAAWARLLTRAPEDKAATTPASEPMWRPVTCVQQPWATLALPPSGALEVRVRAIAVEGLWTVSVPEARTLAVGLPKSDLARLQAQPEPRARRLDPALPSSGDQPPGVVRLPLGDLRPIPNLTLEKALSVPAFGASDDPTPASWRQASDSRRRMSLWPTAVLVPQHTQATDVVRVITPPTRPWRPMAAVAINAEAEALSVRAAPPRYSGGCAVAETTVSYSRGEVSGRLTAEGSPAVDPSLVHGATFVDRCGLPGASPRFCNSSAAPPAFSSVTGSSSTGLNNGGLVEPRFGGPLLRLGLQAGGRLYRAQLVSVHTTAASQAGATDSGPLLVTSTAAAPPSEPRGLAFVPELASPVALGLRVLPPADNGGRTIQGYIVNLAGAGSETVSAVFDSPANDSAALPLTMVVGDLQPSSEYTASVAAFTSGLVGPAITPGKASTPDPIPCPGACSGNGACHAWNGKCTCNASVVGASCDKLAGLLVVAQMGDLPSSWDPWETAAALAFAIGAPAGRVIGLLGRASPGMREVGVLLLAAEYSMETNSLAGSEGAQSGGDGRRALAAADWTFSSGEPYSPAAAVRLLRSTLRLTPRRLAGVGIAGLLLPPEGAGGASGLMPSSAWTESLEAPVAVPAVSCSERSGCGECMSDQACGWCLSDDRCVAGTGLGAVSYLAPDNGVDGRCTPRLGSPGGTPSSAMERWWLHVDAPTTAQRACPTPCSSLQGCNVCAARDDCVWCETLGQCASRASMGIDVDLSGVIQNPQLVGSVSDGSSPSRAPSIAGSGTCGRAVVKPGLCAATRCSSNHNLYHCVADPVCGWCDVPPAGQLPCSPGTSFGPTEGSAPCSSGTYYHRTRISCSGSSCADCLSQSACGWCESTQQCGSASLITGFPSAGHCSNWVAPVNALLSGVPDSMIRTSARALRAAPFDAVAVSEADANAGPMRSDRALAANSTDAAVAARGLADAVAFPRGAYYGSVDSISLHCPASTLPGDSICRPFKSCGDCLGQAKSLGCAWCDNPAGAPFCTSLVAGQTLCSADSRVGASDSNRGAPVLGSATHPDLTQSRCPMLCPQAAVLSAKEGTIQFGSLLDAQASPFESVYRPSEISSCSWFIKPAPTTRQSDGQPIETLIASVKVITFALGRGDGIIVFDGLGPVESSQVLAVFVNASTTTATTVGSQAASVAGPAAAPQSRGRTLSAAAPAHAPAPAPATVGDLPDWLRASLDSAASGRARLPLAHSARGGIEVGRFSIPDSTPVFTGPGAVTAQAGGDLRLVMAVGTGGGGWGFRATHTATQVSYTELQIVLQATGFTLLACVILLAAFLIVSNIRRRAAQRALAVQEAAAGAGADDRVPPRVAMSQDLIDAFPVFVFQKGKLEGTPLEPRKAASATDGGTAGTTPSAPGQGTPASAQGRDGASGEEAGGVGDAGAGAGSAAAGAPPPIRIPVSPVGQGPAQACPPAPVAPAPAEEEEAPSCAVCMCEYEDGEQVRTLACNHSFHCKCIDGWMAENGTCPMCRSDTLEMAVMLLSLTEAGVASPIRIREDVPLVDADHVPRVPLLERLAREGAFSWLGSGHADDSGRESSDDEGDGDQQDSDAEDDHVAPGARAAGGDAVPLQRSSSSPPAAALLPGAAVPPLSQAPRAAVVNPLLGSTQHARERGNPGILRQRGASARVLTNPSRVALPRPPPPAAAPGPAERGGSDASARQVLASRHQGAAGDAPASGIINPMYR